MERCPDSFRDQVVAQPIVRLVEVYEREDGEFDSRTAAWVGVGADGQVVVEPEKWRDFLSKYGAGSESGGWYSITDGEKFVRALPGAMSHGTRLWAEPVENDPKEAS